MDRSRRTVIRILAGAGGFGLAGCLSRGTDPSATNSPSADPGDRPSDTATRATDAARTSPNPSQTGSDRSQTQAQTKTVTSRTPGPTPTQPGEPFTTPFQFDVEVLNDQPKPDRPPLVRIAVTNEGEQSHTLTTPTNQFPFPATRAVTEDGPRLTVVFYNPTAQIDREEECWASEPLNQMVPNGKTIEPEESVTVRRAVMNEPGGYNEPPAVCWPRDTFLFTNTYFLDSSTPESTDGQEFQWGFWVRVTNAPAIQAEKIRPFQN
jgi:hypothetical protein